MCRDSRGLRSTIGMSSMRLVSGVLEASWPIVCSFIVRTSWRTPGWCPGRDDRDGRGGGHGGDQGDEISDVHIISLTWRPGRSRCRRCSGSGAPCVRAAPQCKSRHQPPSPDQPCACRTDDTCWPNVLNPHLAHLLVAHCRAVDANSSPCPRRRSRKALTWTSIRTSEAAERLVSDTDSGVVGMLT